MRAGGRLYTGQVSEVARPAVPELVARGLEVEVLDYRCRAGVHPPGPEEHNDRHSIVFVRRGVFVRTVRGQGGLADANHVLFFNAGEPYRIEHPVDGGDDCTILALAEPVARDLVARHAPRDAERATGPFRIGQALSDPVLLRLQYELLARARAGSRLDFEDGLVSLLERAVGSVRAGDPESPDSTFRRHRDLVEAARTEVHRDLAHTPSLSELARGLGCSPFHLSRVFPQVAGLSLRAYVARLRARAAAERLTRGVRDLTRLALDLGYADHSHFTNAFRREWGVPPSVFRAVSAP
jgi:AraC family transcriptional regulator